MNKQRSLSNLRPFTKGDPRINRKGRPKSFGQLQELAQSIAHQKITDKDGNPMTVAAAILRSWAASKQPLLQKAFIEYAFGKVPEKVATTGLEKKTTLILHYAHERQDPVL